MLAVFIRETLLPLLARLSNHLPGWVYWGLLWLTNHKFLIGAAAVIFNDQGQVLLFRHTFRPASRRWGLPGGWMKRGESIQSGLEREVYEESRLKVKVVGPLLVETAPRVARLDLIFWGNWLGGEFSPSSEVTDARFFPIDSLPELIPDQKRAIFTAVRQVNPNLFRPLSGGSHEPDPTP